MTNVTKTHDQNKEKIQTLRGLEALLQVFNSHIDDSEVINSAMNAVIAICESNDQNKNEFGAIGGCASITESLIKHSNDLSLVRISSNAIAVLSLSNPTNQAIFESHNACKTLVNIITSYRENTMVLLNLTWALLELSKDCPNNQRVLGSLGLCPLLVSFLVSSSDSMDVLLVDRICTCIYLLCLDTNNHQYLVTIDGYHNILFTVLSSNIYNASIAYHICGIFRLVSFNELHTLITDGIEVYRILRDIVVQHVENGDVCENVCWVLHQVTISKLDMRQISATIVVSDIEVFIRAMSLHTGNILISDYLSSIVRKMCEYEQISNYFERSNCYQTVVTLLNTHIMHHDIVSNICYVIGMVAVTDYSKQRFRSIDGYEGICQALTLHIDSTTACQAVCYAIINLCKSNPANQQSMGLVVYKDLLNILEHHLSDVTCVKLACTAFYYISHQCPSNQHIFRSDISILEPIIRCLVVYHSSVSVAEFATGVFRNIDFMLFNNVSLGPKEMFRLLIDYIIANTHLENVLENITWTMYHYLSQLETTKYEGKIMIYHIM